MIFKAQQNSLIQAEAFLRNRNWSVGSTTNLREALAYIIQKNPQYVLITSDHANKKVRMLPKMLVQAFPVRVIGFAEKGTGISTKNLHEMALEYNLYPPVSGPAIERMVLKIRKDDEAKQQGESIIRTGKGDGSQNENDLITFKGNASSAEALKASFDQARAALSQLVNNDGNSNDETPDGIAVPGFGSQIGGSAQQAGPSQMMNFQQNDGSRGAPSGPAYPGGAMGTPDANSATGGRMLGTQSGLGFGPKSDDGQGPDPSDSNETAHNRKRGLNPSDSQNPNDEGFGYKSSAFGQMDPSSMDPAAQKNRPFPKAGDPYAQGEGLQSETAKEKARRAHAENQQGLTNPSDRTSGPSPSEGGSHSNLDPRSQNAKDPKSGENSTGAEDADANDSAAEARARAAESAARRARKDSAPVMESEYIPRTANKPYRMVQEKDPKNPDEKTSIFVQGAHRSLRESVNLRGEDNPQEIAQSSNVACIQVESPRFSGYLVCAMGRDRKIDKTFMDIIKTRLVRFLKDNGEELRDRDTLNLKIQPVDFNAWTLEQAEFLKKSVHDGDEIAIAFFPTSLRDAELQKSASEKMVMIHLAELKEDEPVEFDLYIFMPENNKYLLYTPQGRPFYGKQKGRLKEKGITHMHLRKEAAPNVQKYRAQNFLNDKIANYKKTAKASG